MMLNPSDLDAGMAKIASEIFAHCQYGRQSVGLPADQLACGQFYDVNARNRDQRGLHGTAGAISILLSSARNEHVEAAKKLLNFAKAHHDDPDEGDDRLNCIKQSEILLTKNSLVSNENSAFLSNIKDIILAKQILSTGSWPYFFDDNEPSEVATCYAVLSLINKLASDSDTLKNAQNFLWKTQTDYIPSSKASDIYAIAIRSLILFVLSKCNSNISGLNYDLKKLSNNLRELWNHSYPQFKSEFEVTVEYAKGDKNYYLRLPWQIYLSHGLILVNPRNFYTIRLQRYLGILNESAINGGYKYAHAGNYLSTRTNAILYDFLNTAKAINFPKPYLTIAIDQFLETWSKTYIRLLLIFTFGIYFLNWSNEWKDQLNEQGPLWVEFIGAAVISGLSWLFSTGRR